MPAAAQLIDQRGGFLLVMTQGVVVLNSAGHQRGPQRRELVQSAVGRIAEEPLFQGVLGPPCETASGQAARARGSDSAASADCTAASQTTMAKMRRMGCSGCDAARLCGLFRLRSDFRLRNGERLQQLYDAIWQRAGLKGARMARVCRLPPEVCGGPHPCLARGLKGGTIPANWLPCHVLVNLNRGSQYHAAGSERLL